MQTRSAVFTVVVLLAYMGPLVILSQQLAVPIDFTIGVLGTVHLLVFLAYLLLIFQR